MRSSWYSEKQRKCQKCSLSYGYDYTELIAGQVVCKLCAPYDWAKYDAREDGLDDY